MEFLSDSGVSLNEIWPVMKEVIESDGEFSFFPHGTSMLPLIRQGKDAVVLVKAETVKVGDAVFYRRDNGQFVLHRIVKIKNNEYIMCGDNQSSLEYGITRAHILAKVKSIKRDGYTVDESVLEYRRYVKSLASKRLKRRIKRKLAKIKNKIFKKKTV